MPLPRTIKDGLRNFALEPAQRDQLRKLRASLGEERTARALRMGKETVNLLLYDGGVTAATRDRVADYLRSMTMSEQASAGMTEEEMIAAIEAETPLKAADVKGLRNCSETELRELVQTYYDTGLIRDVSTWEKIGSFLGKCSAYAGLAAPLLQVVSFVIAL